MNMFVVSTYMELHPIIYGSLIGICQATLDHPMDTLKTMKQSYSHKMSFTCLVKHIYQVEGVKGFYRGYLPRLPNVIMTKAAVFTLTNHYNGIVSNKYLSGALAGATATLITCPLDNLKINLQDNHKIGIYDCLRKGGSYSGVRMFFMRDLIGYGALFGTFDLLVGLGCYTPIAGGLSGVSCYCLSLPFDRVKTLNQIYGGYTVKKVYLQDGFKGFYRGFCPTMIKTSIGQGVALTIYRYLK